MDLIIIAGLSLILILLLLPLLILIFVKKTKVKRLLVAGFLFINLVVSFLFQIDDNLIAPFYFLLGIFLFLLSLYYLLKDIRPFIKR
jgi:hypothetical protein